ncbi:hypothetical protein AV521_08485 [Streptomyces sp. IMTB 2501]|nr:hypothetical protein AV521_08485 [Streptomyces sp. IMTB 2501]
MHPRRPGRQGRTQDVPRGSCRLLRPGSSTWAQAHQVVRPGGLMVAATINRFAPLHDILSTGLCFDAAHRPRTGSAAGDGRPNPSALAGDVRPVATPGTPSRHTEPKAHGRPAHRVRSPAGTPTAPTARRSLTGKRCLPRH